jgi:succinylglutamate desuccinylase
LQEENTLVKNEDEAFDMEQVDRIIWSHTKDSGPVVVIFSGIHGNELAGLHASRRLAETLSKDTGRLKGSVYMVSGNLKAIRQGVRYLDRDLNRIWGDFSKEDRSTDLAQSSEWKEANELVGVLDEIANEHEYVTKDLSFIDLHTTSAKSCAFILFNDTLKNRDRAADFPVPQILGIEETIHGTLMSYINDLGFPAIGFEAGKHEDERSIARTEAFLWLYLHHAGILPLKARDLHHHESVISGENDLGDEYYEITYHHYVEDAAKFKMKDGYYNFDTVRKGDLLAFYDDEPVYAPKNGLIFMPLYQTKGSDGFFILKGRSAFWLKLSAAVRDSFINNYLHLLPGVAKMEAQQFAYQVNLRVARLFVKELFHLMGYRVIKQDTKTLICYKR